MPSQRVFAEIFIIYDLVAIIAVGIQFKYIFLAAILHQLQNNGLYILNARHIRQLVVIVKL